MVCARGNPGNFRPSLPGARTPAEARTQDDFGTRRRKPGLVHAFDAPRSSPCLFIRVSIVQEKEMAGHIWPGVQGGNTILPPTALQPLVRGAPGRLVRAEPP